MNVFLFAPENTLVSTEGHAMTRLVLTILVLSTFIVAGILFSPKSKKDFQLEEKGKPWAEEHQPKTSQDQGL